MKREDIVLGIAITIGAVLCLIHANSMQVAMAAEYGVSSSSSSSSSSSESSSRSFEEEQQEAARHFAPDASTMTPEQSAGWNVVSREAVVMSSGSGAGMSVRNAYQGPLCRLAFQMAAPGYSLGHTYEMGLTADANGDVGIKVPTDLTRAGRKYAVTFVLPGGQTISIPELTPDTNGNISFNAKFLGLPAGGDYAMAIMYAD